MQYALYTVAAIFAMLSLYLSHKRRQQVSEPSFEILSQYGFASAIIAAALLTATAAVFDQLLVMLVVFLWYGLYMVAYGKV